MNLEENFDKEQILMDYVLCEDVSGVVDLLENGADPNLLRPEGAAPLHVAAGLEMHQEAIVCLLLQYGANPNIRSSEGETPLHVSATYDRCQILKLLLVNGADPTIQDDDGQTAIDCARQAGCDVCVVNMTRVLHDEDQEEEPKPIQYVPDEAGDGMANELPAIYDGRDGSWREEDNTVVEADATSSSTLSFQTCSSDDIDTHSWESSQGYDTALIPTIHPPQHDWITYRNKDKSRVLSDSLKKVPNKDDAQRQSFQSAQEAKRELIAKLRRGSTEGEKSYRAYKWTQSVDRWNEIYGTTDDMDISEEDGGGLRDSSICTQDLEPSVFDEDDLSLKLGATSSSDRDQDSTPLEKLECQKDEGEEKTASGMAPQGWWLSKLKSWWTHNDQGKAEDREGGEVASGSCPPLPPSEEHEVSILSEEEELLEADDEELDTTLGVMLGRYKLNEDHIPTDYRVKKTPTLPPTNNPTLVYDPLTKAFLPKTSSRIVENASDTLDSLGISAISHKPEDVPTSSTRPSAPTYGRPPISRHRHQATEPKLKPAHRKTVATVSPKKPAPKLRRLSSASSTGTIQYLYTDDEEGFSIIETWFPVEDKPPTESKDQNDIPKGTQNDKNTATTSQKPCENLINNDLMSDLVNGIGRMNLEDNERKSSDIVGSVSKFQNDSVITSDIEDLRNSQIRGRLVALGQTPGPIIESTRKMYLRRLVKLQEDPNVVLGGAAQSSGKSGYNPELNRLLSGSLDTTLLQSYEDRMCEPFTSPDPSRHWREGTKKSSFNYLLLDPRITSNLPARLKIIGEKEAFTLFIQAIFYVGKGKRARPYAHFKEAIKSTNLPTKVPSAKVKRICDIWSDGHGVISIHVFQNVIPVEAYTREAAMIDGIGRHNLTNVKAGEYYGIAAGWTRTAKQQLGCRLLHKAFRIFLSEGERHIRPSDLHDN